MVASWSHKRRPSFLICMFVSLTAILHAIERFFDHVKLGVKWKMNWWKNLSVIPYLGYGHPQRFRLRGRVIDDRRIRHSDDLSTLESALATYQRFDSSEVPGATLRLRYGDVRKTLTTNHEGYFNAEINPGLEPSCENSSWREVTISLLAPSTATPVQATGRVRVPSPEARFAIVSDLDDTVLVSRATNKLEFAGTVIFGNATTREIFPGVVEFYQALVAGPDGTEENPVFYLSSSPQNLYDQLLGALRHHGLPEGPLFLKDFGFDPGKFIKGGHHAHKSEQLLELIDFYPNLPFVLIGDNGQEDAEIYQQVTAQRPGRIRAVFIRTVIANERRKRIMQRIMRDLEVRGVPMHLVASTAEAMQAATELGLVSGQGR